jgi:hypothetical protein
MPPKSGSWAAKVQSRRAPLPAQEIKGTFEERFPLLARSLSQQTEAVRLEQMARFTPVPANFEFSMAVQEDVLPQILAEAQLREFTVWAAPGHQLLGAGVVSAGGFDDTIAWLRRSCAEQRKLEVSTHDSDGRIRFFEYYP